jgi:alpha-amylase/alpha-mannosidase (GH57 family)
MSSPHRLSVHGHFYQPPRTDPLTGKIPVEPGAAPFANWNELIFENCYKPNAELGNFSKISFNIGPTLSEWLRQFHPDVLNTIVQADQENVKHYGDGNAMAQAYHHTILPLAKRRDKQTQIRWGIYEFERTFHRKPKGMWLPETAMDMETLEVLADNGIEFTILAPWQADDKEVDPRKAYQVILSDHRSIKVFFYHSGLSSRISFDAHATSNADQFIRHFVKPEFSGSNDNQWLTIASDGELYGHHQAFRDKFLSYLLNGSLTFQNIEFSFPALQLQKQQIFPIMKIREETSWSCHHGVQRWRGSCACTPNNEWKKPLRDALEILEDGADRIYMEYCQGIGVNPWEARDRYIEVFSGERDFKVWLTEISIAVFSDRQADRFKKLLEAQLDCQMMFTSCGWFFEDFDRIEPKNNVTSAARAVWLIKQAVGIDLAPSILPKLENSRSWRTGITAAEVFIKVLLRFENNQK